MVKLVSYVNFIIRIDFLLITCYTVVVCRQRVV